MAQPNYLADLAGGLRAAAGVLNPDIQRQTFAADEREKQVIEQRRNLVLQQAIKAVESGAMPPEQFKVLAQRLGFGDIQAGPDAPTQARMEENRRRKAIEEEVGALGPNPDLDKVAPILVKHGKPEIAASIYNAQAARELKRETAARELDRREQEADRTYELRLREATRKEDRDAVKEERELAMQAIAAARLALSRAGGLRQEYRAVRHIAP